MDIISAGLSHSREAGCTMPPSTIFGRSIKPNSTGDILGSPYYCVLPLIFKPCNSPAAGSVWELGPFARTCNPSKLEADIWGLLEVRRSAMLHFNECQRPHWYLPAVWSHWGNLEVTRCQEMATLPAGYIPQRKVPSASSSGSLDFIVCEVL